jgi:hypothetical protein
MQFSKMTVPPFISGTVQLWFEEHEGELQHLLWPAQSPDCHQIVQWTSLSVLEMNEEQIPTSNISKAM